MTLVSNRHAFRTAFLDRVALQHDQLVKSLLLCLDCQINDSSQGGTVTTHKHHTLKLETRWLMHIMVLMPQ